MHRRIWNTAIFTQSWNFLIKVLNNTGEFIMASPTPRKVDNDDSDFVQQTWGEESCTTSLTVEIPAFLEPFGGGFVNFLFFLYVCIRLEHDAH